MPVAYTATMALCRLGEGYPAAVVATPFRHAAAPISLIRTALAQSTAAIRTVRPPHIDSTAVTAIRLVQANMVTKPWTWSFTMVLQLVSKKIIPPLPAPPVAAPVQFASMYTVTVQASMPVSTPMRQLPNGEARSAATDAQAATATRLTTLITVPKRTAIYHITLPAAPVMLGQLLTART